MPVQDPRMLIQALRGFNPAPVINADTIPATALARIRDERGRQADDLSQFDRMPISSGPANSVLAGVMRGISKYQMRNNQEAELEDLYAQYEQAERAKAQQMAQAKAQEAAAERAAREQAATLAHNRSLSEIAFRQGLDNHSESLRAREEAERRANSPAAMLSPKDAADLARTQALTTQTVEETTRRRSEDERAEQERQQAAQARQEERETMQRTIERIAGNRGAMEQFSGYSGNIPFGDVAQGLASPEMKSWYGDLERLMNIETLEQTNKISGALSEAELNLAKEAASAIRRGGDIAANSRGMAELYQLYGGNPENLTTYTSERGGFEKLGDTLSSGASRLWDRLGGDVKNLVDQYADE